MMSVVLLRFGRTATALLVAVVGGGLSGCAVQSPHGTQQADSVEMPPKHQHALPQLQTPQNGEWVQMKWPGKRNAAFKPTRYQGRAALRVDVDRSMSVLRQKMDSETAGWVAERIDFSWAISGLLPGADIGVSGQDDAPVRVVLAFDGDRSRLSRKAQMQSELSRALLGEDMPYATLTYVWCNTRTPGTVLVSPRTDRVRKLVVESGPQYVGQWRNYSRDIRTDFLAAFGEEPGRLIGVALMSDGDNTEGRIKAWYGDLRLTARK